MNERQLQQLENDGLSDVVEHINSQKQRIAELECHVEWLRETLKKTYFVHDDSGEAHTCIDGQDIDEAFRETPAQSLGEIKAAAIEEALSVGETMLVDDGFEEQLTCIDISKVKDYARQLKEKL